ncbi:MAG TPA: NAD-dependent deacylase [bacterium]|nr:NAD-dependent deacylase [bacterium]
MLQRVAERLRSARKVTVLTGAGISAESGVPTFRGQDGLWKKMKPEELASFDAFMSNPDRVWEWYQFRRDLMSKVVPNEGHRALASMEEKIHDFILITQNVDGLHHRAGSRKVLELHGNIMRNKCVQCERKTDEIQAFLPGQLPRCSCGGLLRPDVVWFGEMLPERELTESFQASRSCDLFLSVGTSALVHPAASLPVLAKNSGASVFEINTESTVISSVLDGIVTGKSGEILPKLLELA